LDAALARAAGELVIQYPLRACDAVQLASALRVQSDLARTEVTLLLIFALVKEHFAVQSYSILVQNVPLLTRGSIIPLAADNLLIAIIEAEVLLTDNPNHHP
jgi:hypothetical protein